MDSKKVVVKTVQTIVRTYFVEVPDPEWACDGICMGDLEEYSQKYMSEDIVSTEVVEKWPNIDQSESINAAVMSYDTKTDEWVTDVMWRN